MATGRSIGHAAAERVIPCVMELGGKSPAIVFPDADLDAVVESVRWGIYLNAGQVYVNEGYAGGPETPFGRRRRSGYGREKGQDALAHYYEPRSIGVRVTAP